MGNGQWAMGKSLETFTFLNTVHFIYVRLLITEKRNHQMKDAVNKAARLVVNYCLKHQISTIVFGWNQGQRQECSLGKSTQTFVQIPTAKVKERIKQLCEQYSLRFVETEESYSSKSSFLDNDFLPTFGEKLSLIQL